MKHTGHSHKVTHSYDEFGRETGSAISPTSNGYGAVAETWKFDGLGRVSAVTNALGTFNHVFAGSTSRLDYVTVPTYSSPNGMRIDYDYHPNTAPAGTGNGDRRLASIKAYRYTNGAQSTWPLNSQQDYTYDVAGDIATWTQRADTAGSARTWELGHDGADQLLGATVRNGGTVEKQYRYDYDLAGNRTVEQIDSAVKTAGHSSTNQLANRSAGGQMVFEGQTNEPAAVTVGGNVAATDALNRFRGVAAVNTGANSIPITATDANGTTTKHAQVTVPTGSSESYTYDLNGNLLNLSTLNPQLSTSFEWDAANRLVAIVYPAGANAGRTEFSYNGRGQRVREVEKNGSGAVTADRRLVWNGLTLREQRNTSYQTTRRYYGNGVQEISIYYGGSYTSTANYYYVRDHLGSLREVCDNSGSVQARYSYDPWGRRTKTAGWKDAEFGFTGHYYHARSGLHLAFYRAYSAEMGRWLSRDPIGERGGLNIYGYVGNHPWASYDRYGLSDWRSWGAAIANALAQMFTEEGADLWVPPEPVTPIVEPGSPTPPSPPPLPELPPSGPTPGTPTCPLDGPIKPPPAPGIPSWLKNTLTVPLVLPASILMLIMPSTELYEPESCYSRSKSA